MLDPRNIFAAYIAGPGLNIMVSGGTMLVGGSLLQLPNTVVGVTANATNFIYVDVNAGALMASTVGFPVGTFPIATVISSATGIVSLTDSRPDFILSIA